MTGAALNDLILLINTVASQKRQGFVSHAAARHPTDGLHCEHVQILSVERHEIKTPQTGNKANSSV